MKIKFLNLSKFIIKLNTQLLSFYKIYFKLKNLNKKNQIFIYIKLKIKKFFFYKFLFLLIHE